MTIIINGESREVAGDLNLDQLLDHFSMPAQRIAVELNGQVKRRTDWGSTVVSEGDKIEVIHFVGGG